MDHRDALTVPQEQKNIDGAGKRSPSERELILAILKLQTMLLSKVFEFMREYQQQSHWGEDSNFFGDGSGRTTRTGRLYDEVNEIGVALSKATSALVGENLYEKRDEAGQVLAFCRKCRKETPFVRIIAHPYGMSEAYIDGTERLVCAVCKEDEIFPGDDRLPKFNSVFRTK